MSEVRESDVIVVGAGVAGMATALGLAQQGLKVALIGPRMHAHVVTGVAPFDGRIYAVAPATVALLEQLSVWKRVDESRITAVERMRVFGDRGDELTFDAYGAAVERLATIVEESALIRVLDTACDFQPGIARVEASFESMSVGDDAATVRLDDGSTPRARLVIGADGAQSAVRAAAGVGTRITDYKQTALVTQSGKRTPAFEHRLAVVHRRGRRRVAAAPGRPLSLVWSAPTALARNSGVGTGCAGRACVRAVGDGARSAFRGRSRVQLSAALDGRRPPDCVARCAGGRCGAFGASARGQGLNLGLQDVGALLEVCAGARLFVTLATRCCCDDTSGIGLSRSH